MTIAQWPRDERPREKLLTHGAKYLTDAELLAILLQTGVRGKTALDLARELLAESGSLKKCFTHFRKKPGIGQAKFALIQAAMELGRRYCEEKIEQGEQLNNSIRTKRFLASRLRDYSQEVFACLFLDNHHRVLGFEELFYGSLTETSVYPREIIKRAIFYNAAKIILAHNHPSGNPEPSDADREITQILKESLTWMDIQLIDHVIIGNPEVVSLAERGLV